MVSGGLAWSSPLTRDGKSSLVPQGPWVYGLTGIAVHYRADPGELSNVVPRPLKVSEDGEVFAYIVEIVSESLSNRELINDLPDLLQYSEGAFFVKVTYGGRTYAYCPFMYVDNDLSLMRGALVGFPKKLAKIAYTKIHPLLHGEPRAGTRLVGFVARSSYLVFRLSVELSGEATGHLPLLDMGPMLVPRYFPAISEGLIDVRELVQVEAEVKVRAWRGGGAIEVVGGVNDVVRYLAPIGKGATGYFFHMYLRPTGLRSLVKIEGW